MKKLRFTLAVTLVAFTANAQTCPDNKHPHMIDLGLPSGTHWACCNVGATKPEGYGNYFAWGETEVQSKYHGMITYTFFEDSGIKDIGKSICGTKYDVAHVKWGGKWQMPSLEQIKELYENCTYSWTTINGVSGALYTSKINNKSIFLPAVGYRENLDRDQRHDDGYYWTGTLSQEHNMKAYSLEFRKDYNFNYLTENRWTAIPIRPATVATSPFLTEQPKIDEQDNRVYNIAEVEKPPVFFGENTNIDQTTALKKWLSENIKYPTLAKQKGIQGKVVVKIIIEKDGSVNNVKILRSIEPSLDEEAARVAKLMTWQPGISYGKIVRTEINIPIEFQLPDSEKEK